VRTKSTVSVGPRQQGGWGHRGRWLARSAWLLVGTLVLSGFLAGGARAGEGRFEIRSACGGQGFAGTYRLEGTELRFRACRRAGGGVSAVLSTAEREILALEEHDARKQFRVLGEPFEGEKSLAELTTFRDAPEGRVYACFLHDARTLGLGACPPFDAEWRALFLLAPALEGIDETALPCADRDE